MNLKSLIRSFLPRQVSPWRIWSGPLRGQVLVTSWHDYPAAILGYTERPLLDWFAQNVHPGQTWLDIGAHYGYTALALCHLVGASGRVFAFEPMVSTAGYLAQTRARNRLAQLVILPLGLGQAGRLQAARLPVTRGMVDSTLARQPGEDAWLENFLLSGFDSLWPQVCGADARIDGVKIDVQGMELDVLTGMAASLKTYHPALVVELHAGVDRARFLALVESLGYALPGQPVEPVPGEETPQYLDNRSYAFASAGR